jgi:lanthionine synthetase-like protein
MNRAPFRLAICTAVLVSLAAPALAEYVVLVGMSDRDPYHAAADRLARHHRTKHIVRFDPEHPEKIAAKLRRIDPTHVAIVLRPEQIHVNSVRRFLKMATTIDKDPFVDFDFGYITGATAKEATTFVENIIRDAKRRPVKRLARASVGGGKGPCYSRKETFMAGGLRFPMTRLTFVKPEGKEERDQAFLDEHLADIEGCDAIMMGGHGMPWMIGGGPQAEDVAKLSLYPAVVFNYACYTGVTGVYPERKYESGKYAFLLKKIELKRSFALAVIRAGATGYVAYVNPRPAGPEMSIDFQRVLAGASLGESRRIDYAKIVLGYLGFGEPGITVPDWKDGVRKPTTEVEPVRHMMLEGSTGGVLFGDPAHRPFPRLKDVLPQKTRVKRRGDELHVTLTLQQHQSYLWGADPFRQVDKKTRKMAMKLYDRVEIPKGLPEIRSVQVVSATWGGKPIVTLSPIWAVENDGGKRWLHVKPGFARGGRGDIEITLVAGPKAASARPGRRPTTTPESRPPETPKPGGKVPDLKKRKDCLDCARQIGEHLLKSLDQIEGENVYDGAAGVALFFFELHGATGEKRWLRPAQTLLGRSLLIDDQPGLYVGVAGVGQVCIDAWRVTKGKAYLDRARECAARIGPPRGNDVIMGAAGTGMFLLNLHAATGEKRWLEEAEVHGAFLAGQAVTKDGLVHWPVGPGSDRVYIGFSHGAAGIGAFLLDLHRVTGKRSYRDLADGAARFVMKHAVADGKDGWKWTKMVPPRESDGWPVQWCHGSPGIGLFFLALVDTPGREKKAHAKALARCIASVRRTGRSARGTGIICHGSGGNAELFLDVYRSTKDPAMLEAARLFAADLVGPGGVKTKIDFGSGNVFSYSPAYMTGIAGVGRFILRLADPMKLGPAFMVSREKR